MTQLEIARKGRTTPAICRVAEREGLDPETVAERVARGTVAVPANSNHQRLDPIGIGEGLRIKVNANIGTSSDRSSLEEEMEKLAVVQEAKADAVMDLSTGGDISAVRQAILKASSLPVGTVPIYEAATHAVKSEGGIVHMTPDSLFRAVEEQAKEGVDFMTVHAGLTLSSLETLRADGRTTDVVSRGGAFLTTWMLHHKMENPFYEEFDRLLTIARKYDVTLSLGDGLRPGSIADATDRAQLHELLTLGGLTQRAWDAGVQVIIEGPGHVPLDQVEANVVLQKRVCRGAPFYVLGPLVTDVAAGYDHIACAIGGAVAGMAGADFLCYVTPAEHLRLPSIEDVREGIMASRIAAHAADIARGHRGAAQWDLEMSKARKALNWDRQLCLAMDPVKARAYRASSTPTTDSDVCTMCGKFCAIKVVHDYFNS